MSSRGGALAGLRVVEMAGLAPAPFACMLLADHGAEIIRVDRPGTPLPTEYDVLGRGRRTLHADLKSPSGRDAVLELCEAADVLVEGFRPGVMERLGLGPEVAMDRNPALIYGRLTGWGQQGPLAPTAGHDINYLALSGALHPIGPADGPPVPPINYIGDFGGGGLLLAFGVLVALHERASSGRGQVVDAAMIDGAALMSAFLHGALPAGSWDPDRGSNMLDGAAHYYRNYETSDGKYMSVGAVEPQFYGQLLERLGLDDADLGPQNDKQAWPAAQRVLEERFRSRTRDDWVALFEGTDACVAPVLAPQETYSHPHHQMRCSFTSVAGVEQPAPAPRLSRTPALTPVARLGPPGGEELDLLRSWGLSSDVIDTLLPAGTSVRSGSRANE